MKKFITVSITLFILTLCSVLTGCTESRKNTSTKTYLNADISSEYKLVCTRVARQPAIVYRCHNKEVICYSFYDDEGSQCFKNFGI